MSIKAIVFDLGGVVLPHAKTITPQLLSETFGISWDQAEPVYKANKDDWRRGKISSYQFFSSIKKQLGSRFTVAELAQMYRDAYLDIAQIDFGMIELMKLLSHNFTLAVFSNTVDIHHHINQARGVFDHTKRQYMSYLIGFAKPDTRAFDHVIGDLGLQPGEILFIDDKSENIHAAGELGLETHLYLEREDLVDDLRRRGLL